MTFRLLSTARFDRQAAKLSDNVFNQLQNRLRFLSENPRHPSLRTHEVKGAKGDFGGKIFEAYISDRYRMTWEYGPEHGEITLRNVDDHDECLSRREDSFICGSGPQGRHND